jgi:hypothetical protein
LYVITESELAVVDTVLLAEGKADASELLGKGVAGTMEDTALLEFLRINIKF